MIPNAVQPEAATRPRRRAAPACALLGALLLAGCAHLLPGEACPDTRGQQILERINDVRESGGLEPLVVDLRLVRAASVHSRAMAEGGFFDHVGPDGVEPAERVAATGYAWTFVAENLAAGDLTPIRVVAGWLESPLHRDNMLERASAHVGVAYADGAGGRYGGYWTAVFADTEGEVETPEDGCHP